MESNRSFIGMIKFLCGTLLGIFLVLVPFNFSGKVDTILFYYLKQFNTAFRPQLTAIMVTFICLSALLSLIDLICPKTIIREKALLKRLFSTSPFYVLNRVLGAIIALMVYFQIGPDWLISVDTGGSMLSLATELSVLVPMMLLFQTLILEFGAMEFIGELIGGVMRPLFKVSELCAISIISAWVGPGNAAIMGTEEMFKKGYFTVKEVAIIGSQFATGSIGWVVLVCNVLNVMDYFGLVFGALTVVGIIIGIIGVRIPPITLYPDTYYNNQKANDDMTDTNKSVFVRGLKKAIKRANTVKLQNFTSKVNNMTFYVFWLTPIIVCWGTVALVISLYTPLLAWVSLPVEWILRVFQVASPAETASAIMSGFADNYLPVIIGQNVVSVQSRVIIAAMSIIQIIYLSETATLLTSTNSYMKFSHVVIIFLERTFLALVFIVLIVKLFVIG